LDQERRSDEATQRRRGRDRAELKRASDDAALVTGTRSSAENRNPPFVALSLRRFVASPSFACYSCHRIRCFSRVDAKNSWNELVSYLSGGLLYGREVEKPDWFAREAQRKRDYCPRASRAAPRREQVLRRMLIGWTITQIASDLKMCKQQVCDCIRKLCRQENVANRRELAIKFGSPHFQPMDSDRKLQKAAA
jgi:hypothetical protein